MALSRFDPTPGTPPCSTLCTRNRCLNTSTTTITIHGQALTGTNGSKGVVRLPKRRRISSISAWCRFDGSTPPAFATPPFFAGCAFYHRRTLLGDHDGRRVRVGRGDRRHHRGVDDPQPIDTVH